MKKVLALVSILLLLPLSNVFAEMCSADCNCDGTVNLTDLVQMKQEYFRNDCDPLCLPGVVGGVPRTGQTVCYDTDGNPRDCTGTGEDGEYQKGVSWPNPRFTDNSNGTVTDNLTRLIWLQDTRCFPALDWELALSYCKSLANGDCSLSDGSNAGDWRLPNLFELESLRDISNYDPALPNGHPFINVGGYYWTSSTLVNQPDWAWRIDVDLFRPVLNTKTGWIFVWPVRGGQ